MPVGSLKSLVECLLAQIPEDTTPRVIVVKPELPAPTPARTNGQKAGPNTPPYDPTLVFVLELATLLALRDAETIEFLGKDVADALQSVIRDSAKVHYVVLSRVVYYLLSLLRASDVSVPFSHYESIADTQQDHDFIRAPVVLHSISSFDQDLLKQIAMPVLKGLSDCVKGPTGLRNEIVTSPDFWSILFTLHTMAEAAADVYSIVDELANSPKPGITADNYEAAVSLLNAFATEASVGAIDEQRRDQAARRGKATKPSKPQTSEIVVRGTKAVTTIYQMTHRIPHFIEQSHLETTEAWNAYWSPIFRALTTQCLNPCREIRHQAFSSLQRSLLSKDLASPDHNEWTAIFGEVLFPLITQLLKPEVYQSDPLGMSETRVQAATLLCKIFLHYLVLLTEWDGMLDLWLRILGIMDRLMNSGQVDNLVVSL